MVTDVVITRTAVQVARNAPADLLLLLGWDYFPAVPAARINMPGVQKPQYKP